MNLNIKRTIPSFPVLNISVAVQFYRKELNFECRHEEKFFAILTRNEIEIHLWAACDPHWKWRSIFLFLRPVWSGSESFLAGTASCRVEVDGIEALYQEYKQTGVLYNKETVIEQTSWRTREFPVLDLNRNLITFFEYVS